MAQTREGCGARPANLSEPAGILGDLRRIDHGHPDRAPGPEPPPGRAVPPGHLGRLRGHAPPRRRAPHPRDLRPGNDGGLHAILGPRRILLSARPDDRYAHRGAGDRRRGRRHHHPPASGPRSGGRARPCYWLRENARRIRGQGQLDLTADPPPNLVVEVDVTSSSLDRLTIFAAMGVPEVWRLAGPTLQ